MGFYSRVGAVGCGWWQRRAWKQWGAKQVTKDCGTGSFVYLRINPDSLLSSSGGRGYSIHTSSQRGGCGVRWKFPASDRELAMVEQIKNGTWNTGFCLTLNTKVPLTPHQFREGLTYLARQMEVLRLCFREGGGTGGELWVASTTEPKINFKVLPWNDNIEEEMNQLACEQYNLFDGPLWHARLMPCPDDAPCNYPHIKHSFPHQYNLLMTTHHAIIDGVTSLDIQDNILKVLEGIIVGAPVDTTHIGEVIGDAFLMKLEQQIQANLEKDPSKLAETLQKHSEVKKSVLVEAFGMPDVSWHGTTNQTQSTIDKDVVTRLQDKCRARGVTLNAGLAGVLYTTLVELVQEAGLVRDLYTINTIHPVDLRRYHSNQRVNLHGYYSVPMSHSMIVPGNIREHFWMYARKFYVEIKEKLERNYPCEQRVLDAMLRPSGYSHQQHFTSPRPVSFDYSFTNYYSWKHIVRRGNNVEVTDIHYYPQIKNCDYGNILGFTNFNHNALLHYSYATRCMAPDTARRFAENIQFNLYTIAMEMD